MSWDFDFESILNNPVSSDLNPGNIPLPGLGGGNFDSGSFMNTSFTPFDFAPDLSNVQFADYSNFVPVSPSLNPANKPLPGLGGGKLPEEENQTTLDKVGKGIKSAGSKLYDQAMGNPLLTAMMGMAAINALRGPQTPAAVKPLTESTNKVIDYVKGRGEPVDKLTQQLTTQYQSGKIDPADEMRINQWYQGEKAKIDQYYVKTGMPDSTAHLYALQELETKRKGLYDEVRQGYLNAAMKGMGMQGTTTGQVANLQNYLNQTIAELQQSGDLQSAQALQNLMYSAGLFDRMSQPTTQAQG